MVQKLAFIIIESIFVEGKILAGVYNSVSGIGSILADVIMRNGNSYDTIFWLNNRGSIGRLDIKK